jgi:hypothetical protein
MAIVITEGVTVPLRFQLLDDGSPIDLSGTTVTLLLEDRLGTAITTTNLISVPTPASGLVDLTPADTSLFVAANGPYYARFKLVDASGDISFVPRGLRERWTIVAQ